MSHEAQESETNQKSFKNCEAFCNRLRRGDPQLYQKLVQLIREYQNTRQTVHYFHQEISKMFNGNSEVVEDLNKLFYQDAKIKNHDPLTIVTQLSKGDSHKSLILDEVIQMLTKHQLDSQQKLDLILIKFKDYPDITNRIQGLTQKRKPKVQIYWDEQNKYANKRNKQQQQQQQQQQLTPTEELVEQVPQSHFGTLINYGQSRDAKNEISLFDKLKLKLTQCQFLEFMNVVHLYNECIITPQEFISICTNPLFDHETIEELKNAALSRATARRQQTLLFKPLKDTNFKDAEHVTGSYVRMHPGYANLVREDPELPKNILNHLWVSVPFGSEDYSFSIMRKNSFEEQLFKIEDEMYEYDVNINCYRRTIKLLELIESGDTSPWIIKKIISLKSLQSVYKTSIKDQEEVVTLWQKNPIKGSEILRERLQLKCAELVKSKDLANQQQWKGVQKNNFSRSLDHRSFYFKKNERQYTCHSRFIKEAEEQKPAGYLNSLINLTTIKPVSPRSILQEFGTNGPQFSLAFENHDLIEMTFELLTQQCQQFQDNTWATKFLKIFSEGLFHQDIPKQTYNFSELQEMQSQSPVNIIEENADMSEEQSDYELNQLRKLPEPDILFEDVYCATHLQQTVEESIFEPQGQGIFFTSMIYVFMRYFYSIYQRLEIGVSYLKESADYEKNVKLFKLSLIQCFRNKDFKFQDYQTSLFGKQAFLFYTLDKLIIDCCKQIQAMNNDRVTEPLLDFLFPLRNQRHAFDTTKVESLQMNNLFSLGEQERILFRFCKIQDIIHVNYFPCVINKQVTKDLRLYTTKTSQHIAGVFLQRNLRNHRKSVINNLEFTVMILQVFYYFHVIVICLNLQVIDKAK